MAQPEKITALKEYETLVYGTMMPEKLHSQSVYYCIRISKIGEVHDGATMDWTDKSVGVVLR